MLTQEAIAFSELGRLWRQVVASFAETITDEEVLDLVQQGLEITLGRITKLIGITKDDEGTFRGECQQYVNPRLTKRFGFTFGRNRVTFKALNGEEIEQFSEGIEDFARTSKSGRANKSLNCKIKQCGGRCLKTKETCRLTFTPEQEKLWSKASGKNLATKPETSLAKKRREMKEARVKGGSDVKIAKDLDRNPALKSAVAKELNELQKRGKPALTDDDGTTIYAYDPLSKSSTASVVNVKKAKQLEDGSYKFENRERMSIHGWRNVRDRYFDESQTFGSHNKQLSNVIKKEKDELALKREQEKELKDEQQKQAKEFARKKQVYDEHIEKGVKTLKGKKQNIEISERIEGKVRKRPIAATVYENIAIYGKLNYKGEPDTSKGYTIAHVKSGLAGYTANSLGEAKRLVYRLNTEVKGLEDQKLSAPTLQKFAQVVREHRENAIPDWFNADNPPEVKSASKKK